MPPKSDVLQLAGGQYRRAYKRKQEVPKGFLSADDVQFAALTSTDSSRPAHRDLRASDSQVVSDTKLTAFGFAGLRTGWPPAVVCFIDFTRGLGHDELISCLINFALSRKGYWSGG